MTEAPERIWLNTYGDYAGAYEAMAGTETGVTWCDMPQDDGDEEYLRADTAAAQVAAAYERAADSIERRHMLFLSTDWGQGNDSAIQISVAHIRALATDTQTDALEQVRKEADRAGYERLRAKAEKLAEALRTIESHRRKSHDHDDDCGHFRRTFDAEDVKLMEWQARAALKEWYEGDTDERTEAQELAFRKAVSS